MVRGSPLAERRRLRSVQGSVIKGGCVGVFKGILERGRSRRGAGSGRGGVWVGPGPSRAMELSGLVRALRLDGGQLEQPPPAVPPAEQVLLQIGLLFSEGAGGAPKAGVLRDLVALVEAADCRWLFGGVSPATLGELVVVLNGYAAPPQQEQDAADLPSKDSAYAATAERAADVGSVFLRLLAKLEAAKTQESLGVPIVGPILCRVMEPLYIFAATHIAERPWTNVKSQSVAQELLALLVRATGCGSVAEFLRGKNEDEEGRFGAVMGLLKRELTK